MSDNRNHHRSIISSPESQTSYIDPTNPHRNYNQPLINSAVTTGSMSDEEIARQQQERLYFESLMEVDPPPVAAAAAVINPNLLEEIDNDAAIARQLQEEEYSRNSLAPFQSYQNKSSPHSAPTLSDAEIAAHLQAEEDQRQRRQRSRPAVRPQRPTPNQPEVIPFPFGPRPAQPPPPPQQPQRPSSARDNNRPTNDIVSLFQHFASLTRSSPGSHRRGAQSLASTTEDFGPDDYDNLLELDKSVPNKPLTADEINRLPIEKFRRRPNQPDEDNKCNICWDEFEQNQSLRRLQCLHLYHKDCIDPCLKTSNRCPICRMATN
jgi:hypothetical protein